MADDFRIVSVLNPTVVLTAGPAISGGTSSQNTGTIAFSNSNGVSFGLSNGVMTATVQPGAAAGIAAISASASNITSGTVTFANSNGVTFGASNGVITASVAAGGGGGAAISAGTQSQNAGTVLFANSNGVTFGMSNSSVVTASYSQSTGVRLDQVLNPTTDELLTMGSNAVLFTWSNTFTTAAGRVAMFQMNVSGEMGTTNDFDVLRIKQLAGTSNSGDMLHIQPLGTNMTGLRLEVSASVAAQINQPIQFTTSGAEGTNFAIGSVPFIMGTTMSNSVANLNVNYVQGVQSSQIAQTGFTSTTTAGTAVQGTHGTNGLSMAFPAFITNALTSQSTGPGGIAAGTQTATSGTVVFSNSNGISFGMSNSSVVTASYTVPSTAGLLSAINLSAGTTSSNASAFTFSNSNNVSFGLNGATVTATASFAQTNQSAIRGLGASNTGNTAGNTGISTGIDWVFAGTNNITISESTAGGGPNTLWFSGGAGGGGGIAAGVGSTGNTLGNTGTASTGTIFFAASGAITASQSTAAGSLSTIWFSVNSQSVVAGHSLGVSNTGTTAGNTGTNSSGMIVFAASGNITASQSTAAGTSTIWYSVPAQSQGSGHVLAVSNTGNTLGNTGSNSSGTVVFAASGGITASQSTAAGASTVWMSVANPITTGGIFLQGNTSNSSSGTWALSSMNFSGLGAITLATSASSVQFQVPATSSLVGAGGITVSTGGSTITVSASNLTRYIYPPDGHLTAVTAPGNASASVQYVPLLWPVSGTRMDALVSWAGASSATANTCAFAVSAYAGIYSRNASTLSSMSSGSTQTTYSYASNTAGQTQLISGAMRPLSVPINFAMTPGEYFVAFNLVTATSSIGTATTNLAQSLSIMGANDLQTAINYAEFTAQTATSTGLYGGMGIYSAATTGLPAAISLSAINQTGSALSAANIALVMRNA